MAAVRIRRRLNIDVARAIGTTGITSSGIKGIGVIFGLEYNGRSAAGYTQEAAERCCT